MIFFYFKVDYDFVGYYCNCVILGICIIWRIIIKNKFFIGINDYIEFIFVRIG